MDEQANDTHGPIRARARGVTIGTIETGRWNALTDVPGVRVGHCTVAFGDGALVPGQGPARTGVTAILPHAGNLFRENVPATSQIINGFGKSIGLVQVDELGAIETPILLTNTLNVPRVADALIDHMLTVEPAIGIRTTSVNPVVLECNDGHLNDIQGRHVHAEHVQRAIANAADGPVAEGSVGAGTGMVAFGVKGGIGTASRVLPEPHPRYTVGALVLANTGRLDDLRIDGVPVGRELAATRSEWAEESGDGSIIILLATDAPMTTRQLGRLARRAALGLGRTGATASHGSGDIALIFSTHAANRIPHRPPGPVRTIETIAEDGPLISSLFTAVIEATEEAIINTMFGNQAMTGRDSHRAPGLPVERVLAILRAHGRGAE
ncbi:MAG: P1 family peptidase [Chloroflexota bacterium]|nr:P1 family peptidase [Chloroflexota bacterium]